MPDKASLLPLPAAIDAAYLLLVGQLCLSLSKLTFGAVYATKHSLEIDFFSQSAVVWVLSMVVVVMLFINILSCWRSTRSTFEELGHYPNELLTSDILIIVAFFLLNSIASAPVGFLSTVALDDKGIASLIDALEHLWGPVIPLIFFSSTLLVLAYRSWNKSYISVLVKEVENLAELEEKSKLLNRYNKLYATFAFVFTLIGIGLLWDSHMILTVAAVVVWLAFWSYINFSWIVSPPPDA